MCKYLLAILFIGFFSCSGQEEIITIINKTRSTIQVNDNSGNDMFSSIIVDEYSSETLTYNCPFIGDCNLSFYLVKQTPFTILGADICICDESDVDTYSVGYNYADIENKTVYWDDNMSYIDYVASQGWDVEFCYCQE